MAVRDRAMTSAEFLDVMSLPENAGRILELIAGEIVEKMVGVKSSASAIRTAAQLSELVDRKRLGTVTGADGAHRMSDHEVFVPDVAFVSEARLAEEMSRASSGV